jgi:hypothetical protein
MAGGTHVKKPSVSLRVFGGLAAWLVLVRVALVAWPGVFRSPAQAKVFEWPWLALWIALGATGAILSDRTGFAPAWRQDSLRSRVAVPALWGLGFGLAAIATDAMTGWTGFVAKRLGIPTIHISLPASLLVYPGGAIIVEILYRLFPIPVVLWVFGRISRGGGLERAFWVLAASTSLIEPLGDLGLRPLGVAAMASVFLEDYALNLAQAWTFRRSGFLASILLRVVFYLVWHIVWPLVP